MTSSRSGKRRDEDVDTLIGEESTDEEEAGTSDEELREKKSEFFFEIFSSFNRFERGSRADVGGSVVDHDRSAKK